MDFARQMVEDLNAHENQAIPLIFSHGDFALVNMLLTETGMRVIDWESAGYRSVLHDLHNFFLAQLYFRRASTPLVSEVCEATGSLLAKLATRIQHLPLRGASPEVYRKIFFIERLLTLLQRELDEKQVDMILRSVEVFREFDQMAHNQH
jgi:thiamine kinase-like enzyme